MKQTSTLTRRLSDQQEEAVINRMLLAQEFRNHIHFILFAGDGVTRGQRLYLLRTFDRWLKRR